MTSSQLHAMLERLETVNPTSRLSEKRQLLAALVNKFSRYDNEGIPGIHWLENSRPRPTRRIVPIFYARRV